MIRTMRTTERDRSRGSRHLAAALALLVLVSSGACGFFDDDDDDFGADGDTSGDGDGDGDGDEELPPSRGFLVVPKFMLQAVPAIVTLVDGPSALACPLAEPATGAGGYLCDADGLASGSVATVQVERDGFEPSARMLEVRVDQIVPVDVHLAVEGGPGGSLSPCTPAGEFQTCAELCAATTSSCLVTACHGSLADAPIVSFETYADAECLEPIRGEALACDSALPDPGAATALRCCCG
jgi:hypothetical protein